MTTECGRDLWTYNLEGARTCHTEEEFQQRINAVSSGSQSNPSSLFHIMLVFLTCESYAFLDFSSASVDYWVLLVKMTVCTLYTQLGTLLGNHKNNEFLVKFMEISGREENTGFSRKSFSFWSDRLCICTTVFSSPSSAKFTEETWQFFDENNTALGRCHKTAFKL